MAEAKKRPESPSMPKPSARSMMPSPAPINSLSATSPRSPRSSNGSRPSAGPSPPRLTLPGCSRNSGCEARLDRKLLLDVVSFGFGLFAGVWIVYLVVR